MNAHSEFTNVAAHLPAMARSQPDMRAVVIPCGRHSSGRVAYKHLTFKQLDEESDRYAHGLERIGITRGIRTALMVKPSFEFFALTFALFKVGAVIVMIDPGIGIKNLGKCLAEAEPAAFIGIPKAHAARVVLGWARETLKTLVTVGPRLFWGGHRLEDLRRELPKPYEMPPTDLDSVAAILFTSGSTGVPKGAVYTHGTFCAQVEMLRNEFRIEPGEIDLPTFPLFALFDPALGMTAIIPNMDASRPARADPRKIIGAIHDQAVTNTFGSPALIDRVSRYGEKNGIKLPSLRRAFSAGAPVPPAVLDRFARMLSDDAKVYTPYGATEALPVAAIESPEILNETRHQSATGAGYCVGRAVQGVEIRIIKITDAPIQEWSDDLLLPVGETGEIVVRGAIVTREYFNRPEQTALAKIRIRDSDEIYHRMGDVGHLDADGRLWFCGRKSQRVVTEKTTLFTIPCEAIFNQHPRVFRSALLGIGKPGNQIPAICVELERDQAEVDRQVIERELRALGAAHPHTRDIHHFLFHRSFPVDIRHNAKIGREKLAAWAAARLKGVAAT